MTQLLSKTCTCQLSAQFIASIGSVFFYRLFEVFEGLVSFLLRLFFIALLSRVSRRSAFTNSNNGQSAATFLRDKRRLLLLRMQIMLPEGRGKRKIIVCCGSFQKRATRDDWGHKLKRRSVRPPSQLHCRLPGHKCACIIQCCLRCGWGWPIRGQYSHYFVPVVVASHDEESQQNANATETAMVRAGIEQALD